MKSPSERKTEVIQGASEDIRKIKGHHHEKVTSTYTVSSYDERDPGKVFCQLSCQPVPKSWGKQELLRALLHIEGLFWKAKGTQTKNFQFERKKQGNETTKLIRVSKRKLKMILLSSLLEGSFLISGKTHWTQ